MFNSIHRSNIFAQDYLPDIKIKMSQNKNTGSKFKLKAGAFGIVCRNERAPLFTNISKITEREAIPGADIFE